MTSHRKLFPPTPPGTDPHAPHILAWRQNLAEQEIERHEHLLRERTASAEQVSWRQLAAIGILLVVGFKSRSSPELIEQLIALAGRLLIP